MIRAIVLLLILAFSNLFCSAQQLSAAGGYCAIGRVKFNWILGGSESNNYVFALNNEKVFKAVQPIVSANSTKIYPIPATDFISIEITSADTCRLTLELFNTAGINIPCETVINQTVMQLNLNGIPSGIYALRISKKSNGQAILIQKIIKH